MSGRPGAAWLTWTAISLVVAVAAALVVGELTKPAFLEGLTITFAAGMGWSAATPKVIRWADRRLRRG
jgi:hypothetical protein